MTDSRDIAILGAAGMLGRPLTAHCRKQGCLVHEFDLPDWNICADADRQRAVQCAPVIINCAAYTDVDGAETEVDLAHAVNAEAVGELAALAREQGRYFLQISTDFVYDGDNAGAPYAEADTANPINVYGASKLAGDRQVEERAGAHAIVRIEWTYGPGRANFITKVLERARGGAALRVVDDQWGSPTWTRDLAPILLALAENRHTGLFLAAAKGYASRCDVAQFICEYMDLDTRPEPCNSSDFETPAKRPLNSRFDCGLLDATLGADCRRHWKDALAEYLETLKDG